MSFQDLKVGAIGLGLNAQGMQLTSKQLAQTKVTGILHINDNHFVALVGFSRTGFLIASPTHSGEADISVWPPSYLSSHWDGRVLVITSQENTPQKK